MASERVRCDGEHGGPRCADPECWHGPAKYCYADGWVISEAEPTRPKWLNPHYVAWLEAEVVRLRAREAELLAQQERMVAGLDDTLDKVRERL